MKLKQMLGIGLVVAPLGHLQAAYVHTTDVVIKGSLCTGTDCASSESFGFDTIRLKENNLRIHFDDTSASASFPKNDWRIVINDSSNGGDSYFAIEDATAGTYPFRILAGAGNHAVYVNAQGDVGLGTSSPVVELHIADGDSPTLRLEQNGSSGFTPQTWDVAGNETNFFVRDVTNSSKLPFKIKPGADHNSLFVAANNDVGLGTDSPGSRLHIQGDSTLDDESMLLLKNNGGSLIEFEDTNNGLTWQAATETSNETFVVTRDGSGATELSLSKEGALTLNNSASGVADRTMLTLSNSGGPRIDLANTDNSVTWRVATEDSDDDFIITKVGSGQLEFRLTTSGDLHLPAGQVLTSSDRNKKYNVTEVDSRAILALVEQLPVTEWTYNTEPESVRHIGPMAQDFKAVFGYGKSDVSIGNLDISGVTLASVKALAEELNERDRHIEQLKGENRKLAAQNRAMDERLNQIEAALGLNL